MRTVLEKFQLTKKRLEDNINMYFSDKVCENLRDCSCLRIVSSGGLFCYYSASSSLYKPDKRLATDSITGVDVPVGTFTTLKRFWSKASGAWSLKKSGAWILILASPIFKCVWTHHCLYVVTCISAGQTFIKTPHPLCVRIYMLTVTLFNDALT